MGDWLRGALGGKEGTQAATDRISVISVCTYGVPRPIGEQVAASEGTLASEGHQRRWSRRTQRRRSGRVRCYGKALLHGLQPTATAVAFLIVVGAVV